MPTSGGLDSGVAIFSGIRFILLGFDSFAESQYRTELVNRGGVDVGRYDKSCTHVIVSGIVLDHPVCVAAREDGKMLVTELWIEDSVDFGRLADANRVLYRPVKQLNGIPGSEALYICLTGYQRKERDDIMRMVDLMGAHFSKPLIANKITHLICYKFEGEKYDLARRVNIKLVNHLWLEDCLKAWEILPTENYAKSGWEIEVLEAQAQDSEEETKEQSVHISIQTSNMADMTLSTDIRKLGSLEKSTHKGKSSCDAEDVHYMKGMLSTPCRNFSYNNDLHVYSNTKDGRLVNFPDHDAVQALEGLISMDPVKADNLCHTNTPTMQLKKELNEESLDARKGIERGSFSLSYSRKTPSKPANNESLGNLSGSLHGNTCKDDHASVSNFLPLLSRPNDPDSLKCQATSASANLCCSDSKGYLLPQKRKVSFPGSVSCSSELFQNPNSPTCYLSATNNTLELKRTALTATNEASSDNHIADSNIPLPGVGAGNISSDLDSRQPNSKPINCSKISLKRGQHLSGTRHLNAVVSPPIKNATDESLVEEPPLETDWTKTSTSNLSDLAPKSSGTIPSDPVAVIADDIVLLKSASTSHAERDLESLVLNGREDRGISPLKEPNKDSSGFLKLNHDGPSDKLDIRIEVKNLQQQMAEKNSSPDSLKSDITGLQTGISPKMGKGENHENLEGVTRKVLPKKKMCSRPRPNRSKCSEDESSLNKTIPGNRLPLVSAEMEPKKVTGNKQNAVGESIIPLENITSNSNQKLLSKFHNKNAVVDQIDASKNGDKENTPVEIKTSIINLSTNGRLDKNKDSGRSTINEKKVSEGSRKQVNIDMSLVTNSEPMHFILSGNRLQKKHFRMVITHLRGRICKDSHNWSYKATHFLVPEPVRRTEKFFAAAAAGRWILKVDYLSASTEAGKFLPEEPFEWYANAITEDANIDLKAPRKWRYLKEKTGHGAFYGFRIVIYGECIAPSLDTLKRVMKAGDGTILATSPPYTRFLKSNVDFAIIASGFSRDDLWIQEFLRHEIPCVTADYLVEYVCKPNHSLDRHVLFNTHEWAKKSSENLLIRSEEIVSGDTMVLEEDDELKCTVCGSVDRGEVMLICGDEDGSLGCGIGTHIDCCHPPLKTVPEEDWFCQRCCEKMNGSSNNDKKKKKLSKKRG